MSFYHNRRLLKLYAQIPWVGPRMREKQPQKITSFKDIVTPKCMRGSLPELRSFGADIFKGGAFEKGKLKVLRA